MQSIRSRFCVVESENKVFQVIMPPHGRLWFYSCIGLYIILLKHVFLPYSKLNFWPLDIHVSSVREAFKCFQNHWSAVVWCVLYVVFGLLCGVYVCMVHVHGVCVCTVLGHERRGSLPTSYSCCSTCDSQVKSSSRGTRDA